MSYFQKIIMHNFVFLYRVIITSFLLSCIILLFSNSEEKIFALDMSKNENIVIAVDKVSLNDPVEFSITEDLLHHMVNVYVNDKNNKSIEIIGYGELVYKTISIDKSKDINSQIQLFLNELYKINHRGSSNHYLSLSEGFTFFAENSTIDNSSFYLISPLNLNLDIESVETKLLNLSDLYQSSGIQVNIMSLPSSVFSNREFFKNITNSTNGTMIDFGSEDSFIQFTKFFMTQPTELVNAILTPKPLSNFINVPPTSEKLIIGIYRQDVNTKISIIDPGGIEISEIDSIISWELDRYIYVIVDEPISGTWSIITNGSKGIFVILSDSYNPLTLSTMGPKVFPVAEGITLEVGAYFKGELFNIQDAELQVRVKDSKGMETIQIMNDAGIKGDVKENDGIYTVQLPAIEKQTLLETTYTLQWKNVSTPIEFNDHIKIENFPEIVITEIKNYKGKPGEEKLVGNFETKISTYPYPITLEELQISVEENTEKFNYRIEPVDTIDTNKAYKFKLFIKPLIQLDQNISLSVSVNSKIYDQQYKSQPSKIETGVNSNQLFILGLRYYYWIPIIIIIILIIFAVINYLRKERIYGYLTDVDGNILVDFSNVKRNIINKLIFPKRVEFNILNSLPYNGGYFEFSNQNVFMLVKKLREDPNIRINSVPITERTAITSNQWIGSMGNQVRSSKEIPYIKL